MIARTGILNKWMLFTFIKGKENNITLIKQELNVAYPVIIHECSTCVVYTTEVKVDKCHGNLYRGI